MQELATSGRAWSRQEEGVRLDRTALTGERNRQCTGMQRYVCVDGGVEESIGSLEEVGISFSAGDKSEASGIGEI
jgi:hypothetical protein